MNRVATESNTRGLILAVAEARFREYGLGKTTMAEIAEDAGMSAANLYRYFENKQDIAAECAWSCMCEGIESLRQTIENPGRSASERLSDFALEMLRYIHAQTHDHQKISELVDNVLTRRPDLIERKRKLMRAMLAEILTQGKESGEFEIDDVATTARAIHHALIFFEVPIFMQLHDLGDYERYALEVVNLLLQGLLRR